MDWPESLRLVLYHIHRRVNIDRLQWQGAVWLLWTSPGAASWWWLSFQRCFYSTVTVWLLLQRAPDRDAGITACWGLVYCPPTALSQPGQPDIMQAGLCQHHNSMISRVWAFSFCWGLLCFDDMYVPTYHCTTAHCGDEEKGF